MASAVLPEQWFSVGGTVFLSIRLLDSFDAPQAIGSAAVRQQPTININNNVYFVLPLRPLTPGEYFQTAIVAEFPLPVATYSIRCEVSSVLRVDLLTVDTEVWISEIRQASSTNIGVTAFRDPTVESTTNELFSLQLQVLQDTQSGDIGTLNCTTVYLSDILNQKLRPGGSLMPTPALAFDADGSNDPYIGEVVIAQSEPRGLISFADQYQVVNTAVFNSETIRIGLTHHVVMSSGPPLVPTTSVQCQTTSSALQLSPSCTEVFFNGTEPSGVEVDAITVQYGNFSTSVPFRVWYPYSGARIDVTPSSLHAIQGWITLNSTDDCAQQYQEGLITAFADFSYGQGSPVFTISILPLISDLLYSTDPTVGQLSEDRTAVKALKAGSFLVTAGLPITPATVTVVDTNVEVSSIEVVVFSGLTLSLSPFPYPLVSSQQALVTVEQNFDSVASLVVVSVLGILSDGSSVDLNGRSDLMLTSLDESVVMVSGGNTVSLVGSGSGDLVGVTLQSACTGQTVATGAGRVVASIPDPVELRAELSSSRITHVGDRAEFGGIPTSATLVLTLIYPDGLTRDATNDPRIDISLSADTVTLQPSVNNSHLVLSPVGGALGTAILTISYPGAMPLGVNVSISVIRFSSLSLFATPYPPYPGSQDTIKTTLNRFEGVTGQYQQVALELQAVLTDGTTTSVTDSSLTIFESASSIASISGNVVTATAPGVIDVVGRFGADLADLQLTVTDTPVTIVSLMNFGLEDGGDALTGVVGSEFGLSLDAEFSDSTIFPSLIPNAPTLYRSLLSLTSDTSSAAQASSSVDMVTLLNNHHSLITLTASLKSNSQIATQFRIACNLQPEIGDVDIVSVSNASSVPIPPVQVDETFPVLVYINAGPQTLISVSLVAQYDTLHLHLSSFSVGSDWSGDLLIQDATPIVGLVSISGSLVSGISGLVHLSTLSFTAVSPGMTSIKGLVLQLLDKEGNQVGEATPRDFVAGDVSLVVEVGARRRRRVEEDMPLLRGRRNTLCTDPLPCQTCLGPGRETGDVNGDCILDSNDPIYLLSYLTEELYGFSLPSGSELFSSIIADQEAEFDADRNTVVDPSDAYYLQQVSEGLLSFLADISVLEVQDSHVCSLTINATLLTRGDVPSNPQMTTVFFDIALPFDPTLTNQFLYDESVLLTGNALTSVSKGLSLQGGILQAHPYEPGVFGVELRTNLTLTDIGLSVIQVTSPDALNTSQFRTRAMFGPPDPPFSVPSPLDIQLPAFGSTVRVLASYGYSSFTMFDNTISSGNCLIPPDPPIFNQTLYLVEIPEDTVPGVTILVVHADSQSESEATYSIGPGNDTDLFTIGENSGALSPSSAVDFESQTSYQLQIFAQDPSTGRRSTAMANIILTDVNDNPPVFSMFPSAIELPENTPTGHVITVLTATDADSGQNGAITYSVDSDGDTFAVDPILGIVTLQRQLDLSLQAQYNVTITATDQGVPSLNASVILNVTVLPPDPTLLEFAQAVFNASLPEDVPPGYTVLQLQAMPVSNVTEDVEIEYLIVSPNDSPFILNSSSGILLVNSSLDRETTPTYEILVSAIVTNMDRAEPALGVVFVTLLDINDNVPEFEQESYIASVPENASPGTLDLQVIATDPDLGQNAQVEYALLADEDLLELLTINSSTGTLTNTQPIDFELYQILQVTVLATDLGSFVQLNNTVEVTITVTDVNDNPPEITVNATNVTINESAPVGMILTQVSVFDLDTDTANGNLVLSLRPELVQFALNTSTGEIVLATSLDFETNQSYVLEVVARDSGSPSFSSSASIAVTVLDNNDNPPMFTQAVYTLTVNESTAVGTTLLDLQLTVTDNDSGQNSVSEFFLGDSLEVFNLSSTGLLTLARPLDFESNSSYTLEAMAVNIVPGVSSDIATIEVTVTDINEFVPVFNESVYQASVPEEEDSLRVTQVLATDDDGTANISYSLLGNSSGSFDIDRDGIITTVHALDRETVSTHILTVVANDNGQPAMTSSAVVMVTILDVNDNPPSLTPFQNLSISETTPPGTVLLTFTATDPDDGENGTVSFFLMESIPEFTLSEEGSLSLNSSLNATQTSEYLLTVAARDGGSPPLFMTAIFSIAVELSSAPFFRQALYQVSIFENNQPGAFLVQVQAQSRDPALSVLYALSANSSSEYGDLFAVDPESGNVTALVVLDRELEDFYSITIEASTEVNGTVFMASTLVEVALLDQNDNSPQFELANQNVSVPETTPTGIIVASVAATDNDAAENTIISYSITAGNSELFSINSNGSVLTAAPLIDQTGVYVLVIVASNLPEVGNLSSSTELTIIVDPVNLFTPEFDLPTYSAMPREDTVIGSVILVLHATDDDLGSAGEVTYRIESGNTSTFSLNAATGELDLISSLDFESVKNYNLSIVAEDSGLPPRSSFTSVNIQVQDVNDNSPVFSEDVYQVSTLENEPITAAILQVNVTDADSAINAVSNFTIIFAVPFSHFEINDVGAIFPTVVLDREQVASYTLTVEASNFGGGVELVATATVEITVLDVNDNFPQFAEEDYGRVLKAPVEAGAVVITVSATDEDSGLNGEIRFNLSDSNGTFAVDPITGVVNVSQEISQGANFTLLVTAFDLASTSLSNQTTISVTILPPDDLTGGRELDFTFSTDPGLALIGPPMETTVDSYQQAVGFAVGRPVSELRDFTASLGSLSASTIFSPSLNPPSSLRATLLTSEVWHDDQVVYIAVQVRDDAYSVQTDTAVVVAVVQHPTQGSSNQGSCMANSETGACVVAIAIPDSWFSLAATSLSVQYRLSTSPLQDLGSTISLQTRPVFDIGLNVYVFAEMPFRSLFPDEQFTAAVYGEAGTSSVGSYTISVITSPHILLVALSADASEWQFQTASGTDGSQTITAIRADQSSNPQPGRVELFTIVAQVSPSSPTDILLEGALNISIAFLGDSNLVRLLPPFGDDSVPGATLSRTGIGMSGALYVAEDRPLGLLPYASHSELVNTAVLTGETITASISLMAGLRSGVLSTVTPSSCASGNTAAVATSPDCSLVLITPNQTQPANLVNITLVSGNLSTDLPLKVWAPVLPPSMSTPDTTLGLVPDWFDSSCTQLYQTAAVTVTVAFTDSSNVAENVDITQMVLDSLTTSNSSVVAVDGRIVRGVSPGEAQITALLPVLDPNPIPINFTVSSSPAEVLGLDVQIFTSLILPTISSIERLSSVHVDIRVEQLFDFEGLEGASVVSVVFADGSRMLLSMDDGLSLSSLNENIIQVSGDTVTAIGTGRGELVEAVWSSNPLCTNASIAVSLGEVRVNLLEPSDMSITVDTDILAPPGSTAGLTGISSSTSLTVVALYSDGRTQDLSLDPRTNYSVPEGITITRSTEVVVSVDSSAQVGVYSIQISFAQFPGLRPVLNVTVVSLDDIIVTATPSPPYPGSQAHMVTALHPISSTGIRQQAVIAATGLFSNGQTQDLSSLVSVQVLASSTELGAVTSLSDDNVLNVSSVSLTGTISISAVLSDVTSSSTLVLNIISTPVEVSRLMVAPFPEENTFRGIVDEATHQVEVTAEFDDGTQYVDLFSSLSLPNLVNFGATPTSELTIDPGSGLATLRGNSLTPATITVTAVGSGVQEMLQVACNLDPDFGDVDVGNRTGIPVPSRVTGDMFSLPVRVNSGESILDSMELEVMFDSRILRAISVSPGPDWPSGGKFASTINDPEDVVAFGGILSGSEPVSGDALHLADIQFQAIEDGETVISGIITTLAEQTTDGSPAPNIITTPAFFVAGSVEVEVMDDARRRRRSNEKVRLSKELLALSRQTRQSSCAPPCNDCRETGDVDGNCIFDVRDASFLLSYYLNTVATGSATPLPEEQAQYLDIDQSGGVDPNDVIFLLRVNFRLLRFVTNLTISPVGDDGCELSITATLLEKGDIRAQSSSTALVVDFAHQDLSFQGTFDSTNFTNGALLTNDKGSGHHGGLVEAGYVADGMFRVSASTNIEISGFGVSLIQVTFDDLAGTSDARTAAMFSQLPPMYPALSIDFTLQRGSTVSVEAQQGYSPLRLVNNTLTTADCLLRSLPLTFNSTAYSEVIREDSSPGIIVLQVLAISHRPNSDIVYSLNQSETVRRFPFSINSESGVITLDSQLDFEMQSTYNFSVVARETSDNGMFSATAEVVIQVLNINDIPPAVTPIPDPIVVPANRSMGDVIFQVVASDPDGLDNLTYVIDSATVSELFSIDGNGTVTAANSLLTQGNKTIVLNISVSDSVFTTPISVTLDIYLPTFSQAVYLSSVSELVGLGEVIATVQVENSRTEEFTFTSSETTFAVSDEGMVTIAEELDFENESIYLFTIFGVSENFVIQTLMNVSVLDENDNPPIFSQPVFPVSLFASTPIGFSVLQVNASDQDSGDNGMITFLISASSLQTQIFAIDRTTGVLSLEDTLIGAPSTINLTITAADSGEPSLNASALVTVVVMSDNPPAFPLPPTIVAMGGALLVNQTERQSETAFSRDFTLLSSPSGSLAARYGDVSSSLSLSLAPQDPITFTVTPLHPLPQRSVYHDDWNVSVLIQVRDQNLFTSTLPVSVEVQVELVGGLGSVESNTCTPDGTYGICIATVTLPEEWFDSSGIVMVQSQIVGSSAPTIGPYTLNLVARPPPFELSNQILVQLPARDVYPGEVFAVDVYGYSTYEISGFSLSLNLDLTLLHVERLDIDTNTWAAQMIEEGNVVAISAILATPVSELRTLDGTPSLLFSLELTAQPSLAPVDASVSVDILSLSNVVEGSLILGSGNSTSGPGQIADRDGSLDSTGTVQVVPNSIVSLIPWVNQSEVLNTAVLSGQTVILEVQVFAAYASGQMLPYTGLTTCQTSNASILSMDVLCSELVLTGEEAGGGEVDVIFSINGTAEGTLSLRVFYPELPIRFTALDTTLNRIQFTLRDDCTGIYQQTSLTSVVNFTAGEHRLTDVDVTEVISDVLQSNNSDVLRVNADGSIVGVSVGVARACPSPGEHIGCAEFNVMDDVVHISAVSASVLADLSLDVGNTDITSREINTASVGIRSQLEFEGESAAVMFTVQYTDGAIAPVSTSDVTLSAAPNPVFTVEGTSLTALATGEEALQVLWTPGMGRCGLEIESTVVVRVELPEPIDLEAIVVTSLIPPPMVYFLTPPTDVSALAGIPANWTLQVKLEFEDGRVLDVTSDPRTRYTPSNNRVMVSSGGVVTASGNGSGTAILTVEFTRTNLTAEIQFEVVKFTELQLSLFPYPSFPGATPITVLSPIEETGVWQQAQLSLLLHLSNGTAIDVTQSSMFEIEDVLETASPQLSDDFLLTVSGPGFLGLSGTHASETASGTLNVADAPVHVTGISVNPLQEGTLVGVTGLTTTHLTVDISFTDGTQILSFPNLAVPVLPDLLTFTTSSTAIAVTESGLATPLENSIAPISVQVQAGMETNTTAFSVNLNPDVGDVDLGEPTGIPLRPVVADTFNMPIVINTGSSSLGAFDIVMTYDTSILLPVDVRTGPDWPGGLYEILLDPPGEIRLGGAINSGNVSGLRLHLFSVEMFVQLQGEDAESTIGGTVLTLSAKDLDGSPIGPSTPRAFVAGSITFNVSSSRRKRAVHPSLKVPKDYLKRPIATQRSRRAVGDPCAIPPCTCSGQTPGDADGNCLFDIRDVSFTLLYVTESLLDFSRPEGMTVADRTTEAQLLQMDATRDGTIDNSDAYYLLRALFKLIYFLDESGVTVTPVQDPGSNCLFSVQVELTDGQNDTLRDVEVFVDIAFSDPSLQEAFETSSVVTGSMVTFSKGPELTGGVVIAERDSSSSTSFLVQMNTAFVSDEIGISVALATFDSQGMTDVSRTVQLFGPPPPLYPNPLNLSIPVQSNSKPILLAATSGYSPLLTVTSTLPSDSCSDFPLLGTELRVSFPSPFQATLEWDLLNMRMGLDFTSQLAVYVTSCNVSQNGSTLTSSCTDLPPVQPVDTNLSHNLSTLPFTDYLFQVRGPTTDTDVVQIRSPEAGKY